MEGDMMAALGRAAVEGHSLFGHSASGRPDTPFRLERTLGGSHAADERVRRPVWLTTPTCSMWAR